MENQTFEAVRPILNELMQRPKSMPDIQTQQPKLPPGPRYPFWFWISRSRGLNDLGDQSWCQIQTQRPPRYRFWRLYIGQFEFPMPRGCILDDLGGQNWSQIRTQRSKLPNGSNLNWLKPTPLNQLRPSKSQCAVSYLMDFCPIRLPAPPQ